MQCLLALINGCETDAASLRAASALANSTGGNLTVALIRTAEALPIGTLDTVVMSNNSISAQEALTRGRAIYSDECGELSNCRLEEIDAAIPDTIERVSPYHDLIVVGRLSDREGPNALAFSAALWSGRCAVLVSPVSDNVQEPMQHVAVAWNGSAQAGRALRAALPFLRQATEVSVLQRRGSAEDSGLKRYLATHGIKQVQFRNYGEARLTGRGWGRALLSETDAIGADLLVMGAYGHSRLREIVLGGATREVMRDARLAVLLSC